MALRFNSSNYWFLHLCKSIAVYFIITNSVFAQENIPKVKRGKIFRIPNYPSANIKPRNVDIWLPEGYENKDKYAVLYMHDGQMLFDSSITWNKKSWHVDDVAGKLMQKKELQKFIVVGIWNGGETRHADYFPQKPFESLTPSQQDWVTEELKKSNRVNSIFKPSSDDYLKFLVEELKPFVDSSFSVYTDRAHSFVAGSSMGGLISMYALCEYPEVFGGAACLSTHWPGVFTLENNPIPDAFINYMKNNLPSPDEHKLYFDCGDQTLDAMYPSIQKRVDDLLSQKGFTSPNSMSRFFEGEAHDEKAWSKRLYVPLEFLLNKKDNP